MLFNKRIEVGIIGATGYTGSELLRLLLKHPNVEVTVVGSRSEAGMPVSQLFTNLRGHTDLAFVDSSNLENFKTCDVVFFATPHATAMHAVPTLLEFGCKVIDLSADFRLKDAQTFKAWYGHEHACPDLLEEAVYGLVEINRDLIAGARLIALPGCYPTSVQLALAPVLKAELIEADTLIADCKSGISGAGRKADVSLLMSESADNFRAYSLQGHRHQPEILQGLKMMSKLDDVNINFIPHLLPIIRGIHSTVYARILPEARGANFQQLYENFYKNDVFVDVMPYPSHPETRSVKGTNMLRLAIHQQGDLLIILAVEDNLVKGAAGQGVQCLNCMFNLPEQTGLDLIALVP